MQDGETYISVVLNSPENCDPYTYPTKRPALYETGKLMDWVYDSFSLQSALDVGQAITEVKVKYSTQADTLRLYPADSMYTILPSESDSSVTQKDLPPARQCGRPPSSRAMWWAPSPSASRARSSARWT